MTKLALLHPFRTLRARRRRVLLAPYLPARGVRVPEQRQPKEDA